MNLFLNLNNQSPKFSMFIYIIMFELVWFNNQAF